MNRSSQDVKEFFNFLESKLKEIAALNKTGMNSLILKKFSFFS